MKKKLCLVAIVLSFLFISFTTAFACWGGRPLAMGGAFVAVADNPDAVYWNPAGLALKRPGLNTSLVSNWHDLNYDIYLSFAFPIRKGAVGVAYVYNKDYLYHISSSNDSRKKEYIYQYSHYLQIGYGRYIVENLALGISGKLLYSTFDVDDSLYKRDVTITDDTVCDLTLGVHWLFGSPRGKSKMFSLGCVVQDIFSSTLDLDIDIEGGRESLGIRRKYIVNIRPGFGFRPDEKTLFSVEIYDAACIKYKEPQVRLGAERWFGNWVLRVGGHHTNNKGYDKAYTGGIGWKIGRVWEISYTIMHWVKNHENSHLITLNMGFYL